MKILKEGKKRNVIGYDRSLFMFSFISTFVCVFVCCVHSWTDVIKTAVDDLKKSVPVKPVLPEVPHIYPYGYLYFLLVCVSIF